LHLLFSPGKIVFSNFIRNLQVSVHMLMLGTHIVYSAFGG
ncbi:hypothetical protein CLV93_1171, partial [Prolixibacter denitrificans]